MQPGTIHGPTRLINGAAQALGSLESAIGFSEGLVAGEVYQASHGPIVGALRNHAAKGRPLELLVNAHLSEVATPQQATVARTLLEPARHEIFGGVLDAADAPWVHSKTWFFDGATPEAWITNLAVRQASVGDTELSIILRGDQARMLHALTQAAMRGDPTAMRVIELEAARGGLLANNPLSGSQFVSATMQDMLRSKTRHLNLVTKGIDDVDSTRAIIASARAGSKVTVRVRDLAPADAELLAEAEIPTWLASGGPSLRINAFLADDRAYLGSGFLWSKLQPGASIAGTRDIGIHARGPEAAAIHRAVDHIVDQIDWVPLDSPQARKLLEATA